MNPSAFHSVRFPRYCPAFAGTAHRYYHIHFEFVRRIFEEECCKIEYFDPGLSERSDRTRFHCWLDDHKLLFDVSDYLHLPEQDQLDSVSAVFKFHYHKQIHARFANVFAFSPVSFCDWGCYKRLMPEIEYRAEGMILCNQRAHTQNFERRTRVQHLLREGYGPEFDNAFTSQVEFWRKVGTALISVCVPGARLDILDRGQLQYMAFGACTLSPRLSIDLPYGERLLPGVHYLECRTDWCDLIDKIEWTRCHGDDCLQIGANARSLFQRTLAPKALFNWILACRDRSLYADREGFRK